MTNEREILEACAKAMGYTLEDHNDVHGLYWPWCFELTRNWNPLHSLADAAAMAVKMKVDVVWGERAVDVVCFHDIPRPGQPLLERVIALFKDHPTEEAAYCWAVCQVVSQRG